jgi:two-component system CheB/CheR fusion protein
MSENEAGATTAVDFPIVGVGASAGGLAPTTELVRHLGAAPGVALVLVHHLDPTHESGLVEILARATSMPVAAVREGERVQVNHVYIIPPDADITIAGGVLHVTPRVDRGGMHLPIDQFFESLAEDQDGLAVGVVLSGTGFDGTNGVRAINMAGGLAFAQDATALHPAMPTSAVATGCVGLVLPPEGIARELVRLGARPPTTLAQSSLHESRELRQIAALMRDASGVPFTSYKHATLLRRAMRRMFLSRLADLHEYIELLQRSPDELRALCEDALIHVTGFFRDPQVFAALEQQVFPRLLERRGDAPIRIWVPGCSTGEEVYSLAMSLMGCLAGADVDVPITIFGTDVSLGVLETARAARYPESIEREVSPARLQRFFTRTMGGYQISRAVRDACVFARHDITRDPPFSRIDLISCRNLMIYLGTPLQDRVMTIFHYALREPGFLVLGSSETARSFVGFAPFDGAAKIYARTSAAPRASFEFSDRRPPTNPPPATFGLPPSPSAPDLYKEADRLALARFAPPGVVVTEDLAIVHFRGHTGAFLEPTPGAASLDLMRMARDELRLPLRQAFDAARAEGRPSRRRTVLASSRRAVDVEVVPFVSAASQQRYFVVFFAEDTQAAAVAAAAPVAASSTTAEERMAEELATTQRYLESVIEQLEASNEELRAANEEVVSSNEELQSTNEELQTAKEELQATNEELRTVNDEMKEHSAEKSRLNDDLTNVLNSVEIPIVLLGRDMRIRRFTPAAANIFRFVAGDVGRPFGDIKPLVRALDLMRMAAEVLARVDTATATGLDDSGRWYQITIRPYVTADRRIDGVSICAVDVDELKKTSQRLDEARAYAEGIVDTVHECLVVLHPDLRVRSANRAFFAAFGLSPTEVLGVRLDEVHGGMFDIPVMKQLLAGSARASAPRGSCSSTSSRSGAARSR